MILPFKTLTDRGTFSSTGSHHEQRQGLGQPQRSERQPGAWPGVGDVAVLSNARKPTRVNKNE